MISFWITDYLPQPSGFLFWFVNQHSKVHKSSLFAQVAILHLIVLAMFLSAVSSQEKKNTKLWNLTNLLRFWDCECYGIEYIYLSIYIYISCCCLVTQSCLTFCDPMDCSSPGSCVHGISQARILEWVAISFSRGSSQPRDQTCVFYTGRQILYCWAPREDYIYIYIWICTFQSTPYSHVSLFLRIILSCNHPWLIHVFCEGKT